jgi:hypothetical protein
MSKWLQINWPLKLLSILPWNIFKVTKSIKLGQSFKAESQLKRKKKTFSVKYARG